MNVSPLYCKVVFTFPSKAGIVFPLNTRTAEFPGFATAGASTAEVDGTPAQIPLIG